MFIIGIDPGLQVTGYGILDVQGSSLKVVEAGFIRTKADDDIPKRLHTIHKELCDLIGKYHPSVMVLEKLYAHYRHPVTACLLGHVRGVICLLAAEAGLEFVEYGATRVKKSLVGSGHASKSQVQRMVQQLLGMKEESLREDITDALSLAIAHVHISRVRL